VSPFARSSKLKPVNKADRRIRSLRNLERTASTSRVLSLIAVENESAQRPEYLQAPLFKNKVLNTSIILKHRLRHDDMYLFDEMRPTATKIIIPFDRRDLGLGGQSVFVGQRGWAELVLDGCNAAGDMSRDLATLKLIDMLPSLDPFLLREHLRRHDVLVANCYFALSPADLESMRGFVTYEIARLIDLAYQGAAGMSRAHAARLVEALLSTNVDERLEPLRHTLVMEGESFKEGIFSWKGFLYYKWVLTTLWSQLSAVSQEIGRLVVTGSRESEAGRYVHEARRRLQAGVLLERSAIMRTMKVYDDAFAALIENGRPQAFRDFLLCAPEMFLSLGERVGVISHISSYWRYRFSKDDSLTVDVDEAIDIFADFEAGLSAPLAA
jgi:hypothetical protein